MWTEYIQILLPGGELVATITESFLLISGSLCAVLAVACMVAEARKAHAAENARRNATLTA